MPKKYSENDIEKCIAVLEVFPARLKKEVEGLNDDRLVYRHRPGGWTIRQLVNHLADSHLNAFVRTKLTLTEVNPTIKPYDESAWANMDDAAESPLEWSLMILDGLHNRWTMILDTVNEIELRKTYYHPEYKREVTLANLVFLYAWHCEHHLAHIKQAKKFKNKFKL